jgi:hypothetical protein
MHIQESTEDRDKKCCEGWKNYELKTEEDCWIECVSCRNWLHEFCSSNKNASAAVESCCERKRARCRSGSGKFHSLQPRLLSPFVSNIVYLRYIFY